MSKPGDDDPDMSALRFLDDEAIEAVTVGDDVVAELATLAAFTAQVRSLGDEPAPRPSVELQALLAAHAREVTRADRARRVTPPSLGVEGLASPGRAAQRRLASVAGRVAGFGIAARVALGVSVATAGVAGAGVAGALPDGANRAVRDAIEVVTPLELRGRDPAVADDVGPGADPTTTVAPPARSSSTGPSAVDGAPSTDAPATAPDGGADDQPSTSREDDDGRGAPGDGDPDRDDEWTDTPEDGDGGGPDSGGPERYPDGDGDGDGDADSDSDSDHFRSRGQRWDDPGETPDETTPAPAPGDTPDAAGDEGTGQLPARDADAATPTG